jgi:hypothetical protein
VAVLAAAIALAATLLPACASLAAPTRTLTNGCTMTARGIAACGTLMGGAYKANDDPAPWEAELGDTLGVHRLFFSASQQSGAVTKAKASLAKKRLPWISFKLPYSWSEMAAGKGDAWAKDIATRFAAIGGPVWIAFHHEPENDGGDILQWKKVQERLGPIVRNTAPNVGFSVILMGYHQFFGDPKFAMSRIWPNTKVDIAGFDVYDDFKSGKHLDMDAYFAKMQQWSASAGVPWGLAEAGITDAGLADRPSWFQDTYDRISARGGKAFAYFNTTLNSKVNYALTTSLKKQKFRETLRKAPSMQ